MTGAQLGAQPGPMATPPSAVSGADIDGSLLSLLSRVESARASATGASAQHSGGTAKWLALVCYHALLRCPAPDREALLALLLL